MKRAAVVLALALLAVAASAPAWKPAAKRFKWFVVATNVYQDALRHAGIRRGQISQPDFAVLPDMAVPGYLDRINTTFETYDSYGQLNSLVQDARVLEIGPGETLGVALRFLGAGARQVVAVDKFVPLQTSSFHQRLYAALLARLPDAERGPAARAVSLDDGVRFDPALLQYLYGASIEEAGTALEPRSFDIIVSNAVLEEIYDLDGVFATLDRLLKPGGRQVHVIDLRDYGMFSKYGFHPLEFLTIPDPIYRHMVEASGQPNRRLIDSYQSDMHALGYRTAVLRTWVLGDAAPLPEYRTDLQYGRDYSAANLQLVRSIRPRLLPRYQRLSDGDLLTASILLVAEKPASGEGRSGGAGEPPRSRDRHFE